MPDRVLGPGATGAGENADQTDPPETNVEDAPAAEPAPEPAPVELDEPKEEESA